MSKVIAIMDKPSDCQLKEPKDRVTEDFDYDAEVHLSNCPLKPYTGKSRYNNDVERKAVEEYRNIGIVTEFREAKEKQIPKKLKYYGDSEDGAILCPNCESNLWDLKECGFDNCPYCGQAIEWGSDNDND